MEAKQTILEELDVTAVELQQWRLGVTTGGAFPSSPHPTSPRGGPVHHAPRRRYRFYRPHKVHYYLVITGIGLAILVCVLNTAAYVTQRMDLSMVAFFAILVTALIIFVAFFLGFTMVAGGHIPARRLKYVLPHAAVGMLSPLLYTLNISAALDTLGTGPVSRLSVTVSYVCLGLLLIQFAMGKAVVRPEPLRLVSSQGIREVRR